MSPRVSIKPLASCINQLPAIEKRRYVMRLSIAGYAVPTVWRYTMRRRIAFASALEYKIITVIF